MAGVDAGGLMGWIPLRFGLESLVVRAGFPGRKARDMERLPTWQKPDQTGTGAPEVKRDLPYEPFRERA